MIERMTKGMQEIDREGARVGVIYEVEKSGPTLIKETNVEGQTVVDPDSRAADYKREKS